MSKTVKVGLIGTGFVSDLHAHSFKHSVKNAEVVAVARRKRPRNLPKSAASRTPSTIIASC